MAQTDPAIGPTTEPTTAQPTTAQLVQATWHEYGGASEIIYLVGLVFLFAGLWIWMGLGQALFACGCILIATAIINSLAMEARHAAVRA